MNILPQLLYERNAKYTGGLYHKSQIELAYNSNKIEGSSLTKDQTRYIYETNSVPTNNKDFLNANDIVETANHFRLFDIMLDTAKEPLSHELLFSYHKTLKSGSYDDLHKKTFVTGGYKTIENAVGNIETTHPDDVFESMTNMLKNYNEQPNASLPDIVDFHVHFERIHPFQDGNGRIGRIIMFKECLKNEIIPFIIEDKNRAYYINGLDKYRIDKTFLLETCGHSQDIYNEWISKFVPTEMC